MHLVKSAVARKKALTSASIVNISKNGCEYSSHWRCRIHVRIMRKRPNVDKAKLSLEAVQLLPTFVPAQIPSSRKQTSLRRSGPMNKPKLCQTSASTRFNSH